MQDGKELTVVHVLDSLAPGGLENGVVNVARRLQGHGFNIHAACLRFRGDFADRMPQQDQIVVLGKKAGFSLVAAFRLWRYLKSSRADVVHTHNLGTLIYAVLATCGGVLWPIVHGEHGQIQKFDLTPKRMRQRRLFFRCCKSIHVVSSSLRDNLVALGLIDPLRITVTPNGVDCDRYAPAESKARAREKIGFAAECQVVGVVGRLVALKRHIMLMEAFAELAPSMPELRLLIVGDGGDDKDQILAAMRGNAFADRIVWAGHQSDLKPWYQAMDVLAAPSEIEGLSNAVLEAMACGVPVLAHSACGNAEVIEDGESGFLRRLDSADELAHEIAGALRDPTRVERVGKAARETVRQRFSMEAMLDSYRKLYHSGVNHTHA